jgi:hypothetical protein
MFTNVACRTPGCYKEALACCESCARAFCRLHLVILSRGALAGSMGGTDRLHRNLGTSKCTTVWLCEECAAFTTPRSAADGIRPA